jgi:thiamine pyrophosphate-dependent acetolactate synthase large subunit-like protein
VKVYEAMAKAFAAEGTTVVFDLMGDANMYWLNALDRLGVEIYDVRHEGAGLAMADGWGRVTGEPGVCSTTSGPGTAQLATTLVVASRARTPLVAFCGDVDEGDRHNAQHFDQRRFAEASEAGYVRVTSASAAQDAVREAFSRARLESRPVVLSAAQDLQDEPFSGESDYVPAERGDPPGPPDSRSLETAADMLSQSERPVVILGRGAMHSDADDVAPRLGERIGAVLMTTLLAKNWLNDRPFHAGIAGGYGTRTARELLAGADCVLAVGATLSPYTTDRGALIRNAQVIRIDSRPEEPDGSGRMADCYVEGDARRGLELLDELLERRSVDSVGYRTDDVRARLETAFADPVEFELEPGTVDPREACLALDEEMPGHVGLVLGSGQQVRFATMLLRRPRPYVVAQHHFGCIGQGLTTAMGAVVATGKRPAVVVEGDAGLMMHLAEFETAVRYDLPLFVVVMNDEALGAEYHKSVAVGLDPRLTRISTPDLGAVGIALGGRGALVRSVDDLRAAAAGFVAAPVPTLVDVRISREVLSIPYRRAYRHEDV